MSCVCSQPPSLGSMSRGRRWALFLVGVVETMLWTGTIFGWASLVHVLKLQGVYSNLCFQEQASTTSPPAHNTSLSQPDGHHNLTTEGCVAQDERMALVYTVACVVYSIPGILIGYALHHIGLAFTRVLGGLMVSGGFLLLSFTSAASPGYLWGAMVLQAVGGNTIRMSSLQFSDLLPEGRNTAMAIISGIFTPSAGMFTLMQTLYEQGLDWQHTCWGFAAASFLVVVVTPLIPVHHIPHSTSPEQEANTEDPVKPGSLPTAGIMRSICSLSSVLHSYWLFINLFSVTLFSTHFNAWINKFSQTEEEVGLYSRLFGLANILCVVVAPLPGLTMDLLGARFRRGKSGVMVRVSSLQAMVAPMVAVTTSVTMQIAVLLFRSPWAVYVGLICLMLNRPSCLAVGNPFIRARFPAKHFNRLIGIQGTLLSLLTFLQYPHFTWAQHAYNLTFGVTLGAILLSLTHPLHLLNKTYLSRVLLRPV